MTHELKTPISTISLGLPNASGMLRLNIPRTAWITFPSIIFDESERLTNQVEKVLQMAVFNEGKLKLKFSEIDMNKLIESISSNFEIRLFYRKWKFSEGIIGGKSVY